MVVVAQVGLGMSSFARSELPTEFHIAGFFLLFCRVHRGQAILHGKSGSSQFQCSGVQSSPVLFLYKQDNP